MNGLFRNLLWKELYELVRQPWMLIGAFLIPLYLLQVSTVLVRPDAPIRVVLSYPPEEFGMFDRELDELSRIDGIAPVVVESTQEINLLMAQHGASLGVLLTPDSRRTYFERSSSNFERRVNFELATRIDRALGGGDRWLTSAIAGYVGDGGPRLEMRHLSVLPAHDTQVYLPRFLALIAVFLATLFGARSMLRELESRTLPLLITLPNGNWALVLATKLTFVVMLTVTVMAFLLLTLQPVFGFYLRPGVVEVYVACVLAALAASCVGTGLALLGNGTTQAYLAVSVYLIANLILTGFVTTLQELSVAGDTILRALFPLTYLRPIFEGWLFFGEPAGWRVTDMLALAAHASVSLVMLFAIAWYRRRQF